MFAVAFRGKPLCPLSSRDAGCSFSRRSNCAFAATMMVERPRRDGTHAHGKSTPRLTSRVHVFVSAGCENRRKAIPELRIYFWPRIPDTPEDGRKS